MMGQDPPPPEATDRPASPDDEVVIIPVIAEELVVLTMEQDTGGVRATKIVTEREQIVDPPLLREEVTVERKTIDRVIEAPAQVRQEGDTLIIPVMEEVLVVQRQLRLKEEIHVRKRQLTVHEPQRFVVRSERVVIEELPAEDDFPSHTQPPPAPVGETKGEDR